MISRCDIRQVVKVFLEIQTTDAVKLHPIKDTDTISTEPPQPRSGSTKSSNMENANPVPPSIPATSTAEVHSEIRQQKRYRKAPLPNISPGM
jgi:hypothetical protein